MCECKKMSESERNETEAEKIAREKREKRSRDSYELVLAKYQLLKRYDGPKKLDKKGNPKKPKKIHWYFNSILDFKDFSYNGNILNIIIFYVYMKIERAHRMILRHEMIKHHRIKKEVAESFFDGRVSQYVSFFKKYQFLASSNLEITGNGWEIKSNDLEIKKISPKATALINRTKPIRNAVIHGDDKVKGSKKKISIGEKVDAIFDLLDYAVLLNKEVRKISTFKPFGDLRGISGRIKTSKKNASELKLAAIVKELNPKKKQQPKCLETCPIK